MFNIGDYAVCPGHGVGQILDIEEKELGGIVTSYFIVKVIANGMTIMVPTLSKEGLRSLANLEEIQKVYQILKDHNVKIDNSTWNRRYREYTLKIKTGSLVEIADVLRSLSLLKSTKSLSFGEKTMLEKCRDLLAQEICLTERLEKNEVLTLISSHFSV
jgi:CarD family transcriptional regulator